MIFLIENFRKTVQSTPRAAAYSIVGVYCLVGGLWIFLSSRLLQTLVPELAAYHAFQTYNSWFCVAVTAVMLYFLIRRAMARMQLLEDEKWRSQRQFQSLVDESLVGIYIIQDGRFTYVNPRMAEMFGYSQGEIVGGKAVADLVTPKDRERVLEQVRKRVAGDISSIHYSFQGLRKDGKIVDVEVLGTQTSVGGKPAIIGTLLDNTGHNLLQKEFLHAQKMEIVGRLAGGIAHDFNNLLTSIMGLTQLTISTLPQDAPSREDLEEVVKCSKRAAALTRQLLTFSRKQLIQPCLLDLGVLIQEAEKMLRRAVGEQVTLELGPAPSDGLWKVKADPGQMEQVLMNLAVNARDAMPQGGKLRIAAANAELKETISSNGVAVLPGLYVVVTVQDTGCGIDPPTLARIFEPFFTTKEPGKGTGLGLSVVHSIVEQRGGHIVVESALGKGTTFHVYLPRELERESVPATDSKPAPSYAGKETILVIDDEAEVVHVLRRILEGQGYAVLCAGNYDEALRIVGLHKGRIDLIVTDTLVPGKSGLDLAEKLRSPHPEARTLFISGHTDESIVRTRIIESQQPFLPKPFTSDSFLAKVRAVLDAVPALSG